MIVYFIYFIFVFYTDAIIYSLISLMIMIMSYS